MNKNGRVHVRGWMLATVLASLVFGYANSYGLTLSNEAFADASSVVLVVRFVLSSPFFVALFCGLFWVADVASQHAEPTRRSAHLRTSTRKPTSHLLEKLGPRFTRRSVVRYAAILFVLRLPLAILLYPGVSGWDTFYQIFQCYPHDEGILFNPGGIPPVYVHHMFSDHHPLFDTLLYGAFARGSDALFGSWNVGFFVLSILHAAGTSVALTASIAWTERVGTSRVVRAVAFLACAILPFFAFYSVTVIKDVTNTIAFLLYATCVAETVRTKGAFLSSKGSLTALALSALFVALTKKTGMYLVALTALVLLVFLRQNRLRLVLHAVLPLFAMMLVLPSVVFPLLDVIPGGKQEKYGFMMQQVARCAVEYPNEVTPTDREIIDAVIPYDSVMEDYDPLTTDSVKNNFKVQTCTDEDMSRFMELWMRWGLSHPTTYLSSLVAICNPFFCLEGPFDVYTKTQDVRAAGPDSKLSVPALLEGPREAVCVAYRWLVHEAPQPLHALFSTGLYSFLIPALCTCVVLRRRPNLVLATTPIWISILFLLISPVFMSRYALGIVYACPFLLGLCCCSVEPDLPGARHLNRDRQA